MPAVIMFINIQNSNIRKEKEIIDIKLQLEEQNKIIEENKIKQEKLDRLKEEKQDQVKKYEEVEEWNKEIVSYLQ